MHERPAKGIGDVADVKVKTGTSRPHNDLQSVSLLKNPGFDVFSQIWILRYKSV